MFKDNRFPRGGITKPQHIGVGVQQKHKLYVSSVVVALLAVILYQILMELLGLSGLSLTKVLVTLLLWISCCLSFLYFITNYRKIKANLPRYAFNIYIILIYWNVISIFRSMFDQYDSIATLFGNPYTSLALLVPFSLAFGVNIVNLRKINRVFIGLLNMSVFFMPFIFLTLPRILYYYSIYGIIFLITTLPFQSSKDKLIICLSSIVLSYLTIAGGSRAMLIRIFLLYLSLIAIYSYKKFKFKWIPAVAISTLFLPFYLLQASVNSGESFFQTSVASIQTSVVSTQSISQKSIFNKSDTRTFLYTDVFHDLEENNKLLIGKGSNSKYYSDYFKKHGEDASQRLHVEVGILGILLKGGLIAVILNLALLFIAIYLAFYKTNNYYVMGIAFMLLVHTLILFIENIINYSIYDFTIWFFIGVCLSKKLRMLNNEEIKYLLLYGNRKSLRF